MNIQKMLLLASLLSMLMTGCSSSQKLAPAPPPDENQEISLKHFLEGSLLDLKGDFAKAILEYQDALHFKQDPAIYHVMAKDYSILDKHDLAIQMGRESVRLDPNNRGYHETLADIYISALDLDGAVKEFGEVVRIDSGYQTGWLSLARLLQIRQPAQALIVYQQAIDRFGPDADAYFQMAQIYGATGKLDKAAESLRGMLSVDPGNFEIKKALGDTYLREDSVEAALKVYDELVELHPENLELRAAIAHAYLTKQDYGHAAEQFDIVMQKDSLSVEDQLRFGQVFVTFIQRDSLVAPYALKLIEKIKNTYPNDWRPYWYLGEIENVMRNDSSALLNFQKVKDLANTVPEGWLGVAGIYFDRNKDEDAIRVLSEAKKVLPEEFRVHFLLGLVYQRKRELVDAALSLEKAVDLNGKSVDAMSALALVYDELKRHDDSDTMYERVLRQEPHNHLALNNYAYSLAERGLQLERDLKMSKDAVTQQPTNQSYLDTYGWIYYEMGRYDDAERYVRKAIDLGSKSAVIHEHLGDILIKTGKKDQAIEYWRKALELDPSNEALKGKILRGSM
jgi:tetratricopeptide (TPR) repeat protein